MDAAAQNEKLPVDWLATVNGNHPQTAVAPNSTQLIGYLDGQLAGGSENDGLRNVPRDIRALDERNSKRGGLAGSGQGLGHDVTTLHEERNCFELNGCWFFEP
jgi:hypothetical protein